MNGTLHDIWLLLLSGASAGLGWFLRVLYEEQRVMAKDLRDLEVKMIEDYVPNTRMKDITDEIFDRFDRFDKKLDTLFSPTDRRRGSSD